nr:MAG TPA: hypothetical protein [Caudoviricetes sp.]
MMHTEVITLNAMFFMQCPEIHATLNLSDVCRHVHPLWRMVKGSGTLVPPKAIILLMPALTLISTTLATWLIYVYYHRPTTRADLFHSHRHQLLTTKNGHTSRYDVSVLCRRVKLSNINIAPLSINFVRVFSALYQAIGAYDIFMQRLPPDLVCRRALDTQCFTQTIRCIASAVDVEIFQRQTFFTIQPFQPILDQLQPLLVSCQKIFQFQLHHQAIDTFITGHLCRMCPRFHRNRFHTAKLVFQ